VLADVRRARTRLGRERLGRFGIEGTRLHERALRAGLFVESALAGASYAAAEDPRVVRLLGELERRSCAVHVVPDELLTELTEGRDLGAIVGLVRAPAPVRLASLAAAAAARPVTVLAAVDVEEPGNVGAMVRTALAGGAAAFAAAGISDVFHPKALRTSMGAPFRIPVLSYPDGATLLDELRREEYQIVAAASRGGRAPRGAPFDRQRVALLIGREAFGLPAPIHESADLVVSIPMTGEVDSFSVNAAAAILLYEISVSR